MSELDHAMLDRATIDRLRLVSTATLTTQLFKRGLRNAFMQGVRALGLRLASQQIAQVSLNLTRPEHTPLPAVFGFVRAEANARGTDIAASEIIGAIPLASLGGQSPKALFWHRYNPAQILETWLQP